MDITITADNQSVVSTFICADMASKQLTELGITILDTSVQHGKASIRIARHGYCDSLISEGRAAYVYTAGIKHGVFNLCDCRVYWSESIH